MIFSIIFLPAFALCMMTREYRALGVIMLSTWICNTAPFRGLFEIGDTAIYFDILQLTTGIILYIFCKKIKTARAIIALMSLSIIFVYYPLSRGYISLHTALILTDLVGYMEIVAIYGGAFRNLLRRNTALGAFARQYFPLVVRGL